MNPGSEDNLVQMIDTFDDRIEIMSPGGMPDGSLVQELDVLNVPSDRRNGVLADVFDRLDYMEREGSGFKKIVGAYSSDVSHNPKSLSPKFYSAVGCFVVTLPNLNGSQESSQESSQETGLSDLSAGARKAYALIAEDKKITAAMIAKRLGVSSRMVFKYISDLRRIGLRHVGPDKGGHWEVVR